MTSGRFGNDSGTIAVNVPLSKAFKTLLLHWHSRTSQIGCAEQFPGMTMVCCMNLKHGHSTASGNEKANVQQQQAVAPKSRSVLLVKGVI